MGTTAVQSDTFTGADFKRVAKDYAAQRKLVDALSGVAADKIDEIVGLAKAVISDLDNMSESGKGYTPPVELEFGSDSAAAIADAIRGRRKGLAKVRSLFAKVGK